MKACIHPQLKKDEESQKGISRINVATTEGSQTEE